jgi:hypothetical protein
MPPNHYSGSPPQPSAQWNPTGPDAPQKHSELGIASLIVGVISILLFVGYIGLAVIFTAGRPAGSPPPRDSPMAIIAGFMGIGAFGLSLIGTILAIIGACLSNRNKLFVWIGLASNLVTILACGALICLAVIGIMAIFGTMR